MQESKEPEDAAPDQGATELKDEQSLSALLQTMLDEGTVRLSQQKAGGVVIVGGVQLPKKTAMTHQAKRARDV